MLTRFGWSGIPWIMVRDARRCRAPHHEAPKLDLILRSPPEAGVSKDGATALEGYNLSPGPPDVVERVGAQRAEEFFDLAG